MPGRGELQAGSTHKKKSAEVFALSPKPVEARYFLIAERKEERDAKRQKENKKGMRWVVVLL
jgi:hypothetical protein